MGRRRRTTHFLRPATRPCLICGHPYVAERLATLDLRRGGWTPGQPGAIRPACGHPQAVVPVRAPGIRGWWTLIPLLGQTRGPVAGSPPPGFDMVVGDPSMADYLETDEELRALMSALVEERAVIARLADDEACQLCGQRVPLTLEHAPSQAAGNAGPVYGLVIDPVASAATGSLTWTADEPVEDGATFDTLCEPCNNDTGRRYNSAYVALSQTLEPLAIPANAGRWFEVGIASRPLIAKQALTWLVATSDPGVTARHPHLRPLLLKTSATGSLAPLRLWCHIMTNRIATYTGFLAHVDRVRRRGQLVAGFAWWPLAWVLTFGDEPVEGAAEVSDWLRLRKHTHHVAVGLPVQWRWTIYPTDFRTPEQAIREATAHEHRGRIHLR